MGDVGHGERQALLQRANLFAHLAAQARIEVRQGLIKQQHLGLEHQRTRKRHTLLLTARQLAGQAVIKPHQPHAPQRVDRVGARHLLGLA